MEFWLVLGGTVAVIWGYPYIRCLVKRLSLGWKLRRVCRKHGFVIHRARFFWLLGGRWGRHCDFYIETPSEVLAVKLFGMRRRRSVLIFREDGTYFVRNFIAFISYIGQGVRFPIDGKPHALPLQGFRHRYREEWEIKTPRRVLLVHPTSYEIRRQPRHGAEVIVGGGDVVHGMEICSASRLLRNLEDAV